LYLIFSTTFIFGSWKKRGLKVQRKVPKVQIKGREEKVSPKVKRKTTKLLHYLYKQTTTNTKKLKKI